ncbi:expressed protein [Phakopsora pachyrhizi]|uniref:Expressed protein n=1 Tax=Phakopsora pachyrhizi TaxID=170000 RepID=A0AAV0BS21_PHAPC|nr:expressed protein [Phakopsora pachyrhizi]
MEAGTLEDYSFQNKIMELDHNLCGMAGLGMVSTEANARSHSEINQAVMHFDSDQSTDPEQLEIEMIDECEAAILPSQPRISFSSASFSSNPAPLCDSSLFKTGSSFEGTLPASKILTDTTTLSPFLSGDENFTFSRCCEPLNSEVYLPEPKEHLQLFAEVIELTSTSATEPADELRHSELPDRMEDEGLSSASNEQESLELINTSEDLSSETCAKLDESLNQSLNLKTPAEEVEPFLSKSSLQSALSDLNSAAENLPSSGSEGETVHQPFYDDHDAFKCSRVNDGNSKLDQMSCNLAEDLPYIDDEYDSRPKPRVDLLESIEVVDPGMYLPGDEWVEADGNRAPPVRLICEGCEYSLFRRIEPPVTFQAEAAAPISPSDDQTVLLSEVEYRDLYYGPIETFIQSLHRIFPNLNADHNEFVLNFPDLEIKITEDNIYTKELSIFDFDRLHAGGKLPDRLLICLEKQPRLVHCFNVLAAYVNGLSKPFL